MKLTRLGLLGLLLLGSGVAHAAPYVIVDQAEGNGIVFHSKAPMESFDGKTNRVTGSFDVDPSSLPAELELEVRVDMASLDTGIGLRNRHMRENHLETDEFPHSTFTATRVIEGAGAYLTTGAAAKTIVEGEFNLHGVTRTIQVPIIWTMDAASGAIHLAGEFSVELPDYKIKRPRFLVVKLANKQKVTVELHGVPQGSDGSSSP